MSAKMQKLSDGDMDQVTGGATKLSEEENAMVERFKVNYTCEKCGCQYTRISQTESLLHHRHGVHYCDTCLAPLIS